MITREDVEFLCWGLLLLVVGGVLGFAWFGGFR